MPRSCRRRSPRLPDIHDWPPGSDITLRLVRAIAAGCRAEPALNAWYLGRDAGRRLHEKVNLGIAMDTEDGLFVPVLRDVAARSEADLRRGLARMKADIRARSVPLEELRGQTITLSNFGMFGGRHAALVVMPPQVAIIGAGRSREAVVARDGQPTVRRVLPLSLTFDHRPVMGGEASRFLAAVVADLETGELTGPRQPRAMSLPRRAFLERAWRARPGMSPAAGAGGRCL